MKDILFQMLSSGLARRAAFTAVLAVAICIPAGADTLDSISDPTLREYTRDELEKGAPSLYVTSRVVYRDAIETLQAGDWKGARERLLLSASISGEYPDPLFTLARIELMHAHPDFLYHLLEGLKRLAGGWHRQAMLALNILFALTVTATATLFISLVALLCRYWKLIDHRLREVWSSRYAFPPARSAGILVIAALAFMRLGIAVYTSVLIVFLWPLITRREKVAVSIAAFFLIAVSVASPFTRALVPAVDEGSVTRKFSRINISGAHRELLGEIESIEGELFSSEKEFALGTLNYRLGRYEEARSHLLASVSERDDFAPAYLNLGNVYFMQSDYNRALAGYHNVTGIDSTSAVAHFNIGQAYINKMLFAQSSSALKRASELGIDGYRRAHPAVTMRDMPVYESGFPTGELWSIAWKESRQLDSGIIDSLMRPVLLVPIEVFGYMLMASIFAGIVLAARRGSSREVFYCDNCGAATCVHCSDDETGLDFCRDCSRVIKGLSSIKVMEALLRHRRQKLSVGRVSRRKWISIIVPGSVFFSNGSPLRAAALVSIDVLAVASLVWSGFYFKDPRGIQYVDPVWKVIAPSAVLAAVAALSLMVRPPREQRNFRILPPDFRIEPVSDEKAERPQVAGPATNEEKFDAFIDSL